VASPLLFTYELRSSHFKLLFLHRCKIISVNKLHLYTAEAKCCLWVHTLYSLMYTVQFIQPFRHSCCYNVFSLGQHNPKIAHSGGSRPPPNTWFCGPTRVYKPNGISIGSAVSLQLTVFSPYTLPWGGRYPQNLPFPWRDQCLNLIYSSLGLPESTTQMASRLLVRLCRDHACD